MTNGLKWERKSYADVFAYENPRDQQIEIMEFIYSNFTSTQPKIAIFEASTGIGKTAAALAASLRYIHKVNKVRTKLNEKIEPGKGKFPLVKLLVLGRTYTQSERVMEELDTLGISGISLRGKQAMCTNRKAIAMAKSGMSFTKSCSLLCKSNLCHQYNNLKKKVYKDQGEEKFSEWIRSELSEVVHAPAVIKFGKQQNLCPYEISRVILKTSDVIACSYQYLFNPLIRKRFFKALGITISDCVAIIDECHGLPSLARDMQQHVISKNDAFRAMAEVELAFSDPLFALSVERKIVTKESLKTLLSAITSFIMDPSIPFEERISEFFFLKSIEIGIEWDIKPERINQLNEIVRQIDVLALSTHIGTKGENKNLTHSSFKRIVDALEFLLKNIGKQDLLVAKKKMQYVDKVNQYIKIARIDPVPIIHPILSKIHRAVLMTGTLGHEGLLKCQLSPLLAKQGKFVVLKLSSPYTEQCNVYAIKNVTTKFTKRSDKMYSNYVKIISDIVSLKKYTRKNVGIFVPSYNILNKLLDHGLKSIERKNSAIYISKRGISSSDTQFMIDAYKRRAGKGAILVSVLGGRSSEGADFPGKEMEVVLIVGIPYPPRTVEITTAEDYYKSLNLPWFEIVYNYPAFYSINQAAGRAIRSLNDTADIYFLDERISEKRNRNNLSGWLKKNLQVKNIVNQSQN